MYVPLFVLGCLVIFGISFVVSAAYLPKLGAAGAVGTDGFTMPSEGF